MTAWAPKGAGAAVEPAGGSENAAPRRTATRARGHLLRPDLEACLKGLDLERLSPLERVLLTTDGTVTDVLAAHAWEPIAVRKIGQAVLHPVDPPAWLDAEPGAALIEREILLYGERSRRRYLHAHSFIALDALPRDAREALLDTLTPLGEIMQAARLETFREILQCGLEASGPRGRWFARPETTPLVYRTYRVIHRDRPLMLITERFPPGASAPIRR